MSTSLVILAAGLGSRFGGTKQLEPVGPAGEALLDYAIHDGRRAGFARIVIVGREDIRAQLAAHVLRHHGPGAPVAFVDQHVDRLPPGVTAPASRSRPWGTGHAVLCAAGEVSGPFAACNADDWYGATSFRAAATHLARAGGTARPGHAIIGYRLGETLSTHGGVSRAIATTSATGQLASLVEVADLVRGPDGIRGRVGQQQVVVDASTLVSMNLWAFDRRVLVALEDQFRLFIQRSGNDPAAEFPLSTAINEQVQRGIAEVSVVPTREPWMGLTFGADLERVRTAIAGLVQEGAYPADLRLPG